MKRKIVKLSWLLLLPLIALGGIAYAQSTKNQEKPSIEKHAYKHKRGGERRNREMNIPDLNDDQKAKIKTIRLKFHEEVLPVRNVLGEKRAKLRTLTTAKEVNMKTVNKLVGEIGDLKTDIMKKKVEKDQKVRQLLNDEQRMYLDSKRKRHHRGKGAHRRS